MTFELLKLFHLISIFVFLCASTGNLFSKSPRVFLKVLSALSGFAIFFSGLAMVQMLHMGFPFWAMAKGILWILISGLGAACAMRLRWRLSLLLLLILVAGFATFLAIYKPQ